MEQLLYYTIVQGEIAQCDSHEALLHKHGLDMRKVFVYT